MDDYTATRCKECGLATKLRRREYKVAGEIRYHVGAFCEYCNRFTLPWVRQKIEYRELPIVDVEGMVALRDLLNPRLLA
jgi:hypothetical protein